MKELSTTERRALTVILVAGAFVLASAAAIILYQFAQDFFGILFLFFVAGLLAFIISPVADWIGDRSAHLAGGLAATLVFTLAALVMVVGLVILGASAFDATGTLLAGSQSSEDAVARVLAPFSPVLQQFGLEIQSVATSIVSAVGQSIGSQAQAIAGIGVSILGQALTIVFIAVLLYSGRRGYQAGLLRLVPERHHDLLLRLEAATHRSFSGYLRGQVGVGFVYGVLAAVVSFILGLPLVPLVAFSSGLLQTIPFFGQLISWLPPVFIALVFAPDALFPTIVLMGVGAVLVQQFVQPRIVGRAIGLDPMFVLAAVFIGAQLFGAAGAIFGVPFLAIFVSMFRAWLDENVPLEPDDSPGLGDPPGGVLA